jgi:hypothetical protein
MQFALNYSPQAVELLQAGAIDIDQFDWAQSHTVACEYGGIGPMFDWRSDADVIARDIPRMVERVKQKTCIG